MTTAQPATRWLDASTPTGPVFIGGLAHSGKTALRLSLEQSQEISFTRKTYLWRTYLDRFGDLSNPAELDRCLASIESDRFAARLSPDIDRLRKEIRNAPSTAARLIGLVHTHHAQRMGKARWGDQIGMVEGHASTILSTFPEARMIHMIADPRSYTASMSPITASREIARWDWSLHIGKENRRRFPGTYQVVRLEDLIQDPPAVISRLCQFVGVAYRPTMTNDIEPVGGAWDARGIAEHLVAEEMLDIGYSPGSRRPGVVTRFATTSVFRATQPSRKEP